MKCPKCGHSFKDEGRSKGGKTSKRKITPEQQAKMQEARRKVAALVRRLRCSHEWTHKRNIYGDEINIQNARSVWVCRICGKFQWRNELHYPPNRAIGGNFPSINERKVKI